MPKVCSVVLSCVVGSLCLYSQQVGDRQTMSAPSLVYSLPSMPVGSDDLINIAVYDAPDLTRSVRVGSNGAIRLPLLKQEIPVAGLMPSEIEKAIGKRLQEDGILVDPVVSVSVAEYNSRPISVTGAVKSPVTFQALPGTTLMSAITRAQGLSDLAGPYIVVTRRISGRDGSSTLVSQRISARALFDGKDSSLDMTLVGGEEVRVPEMERFYVVGQVKKPGAYPVRDQSDATVMKAVALSEGLDRYAAKVAYVIKKEATGDKQPVPIELAKILDRKMPDVPLEPNDILYIPDSKAKRLTLGSLNTLMILGTAATSSAIYATR